MTRQLQEKGFRRADRGGHFVARVGKSFLLLVGDRCQELIRDRHVRAETSRGRLHLFSRWSAARIRISSSVVPPPGTYSGCCHRKGHRRRTGGDVPCHHFHARLTPVGHGSSLTFLRAVDVINPNVSGKAPEDYERGAARVNSHIFQGPDSSGRASLYFRESVVVEVAVGAAARAGFVVT